MNTKTKNDALKHASSFEMEISNIQPSESSGVQEFVFVPVLLRLLG